MALIVNYETISSFYKGEELCWYLLIYISMYVHINFGEISFMCNTVAYGIVKVIIEKSRGEVSLMEQDTIENVS